MLRDFTFADFLTLANAACGVGAIFAAVSYVETMVIGAILTAIVYFATED